MTRNERVHAAIDQAYQEVHASLATVRAAVALSTRLYDSTEASVGQEEHLVEAYNAMIGVRDLLELALVPVVGEGS